MEQVKKVKGFEGRFIISNYGKIYSINGKYKGIKELSPCIDSTGYRSTNLRNGKLNRRVRVHVLVAEHFLKREDHHECVNHKDGNKLNNHVDNLEWTTLRENCRHSFNEIYNFKGENHHNSKLTKEDVLKIRSLYWEFKLTQKEISKMFNIGRRHVGDIVNRVCWTHI